MARSKSLKSLSTLLVLAVVLTLFAFPLTASAQNTWHVSKWTKYEGNPVLNPGSAGEWDDFYVYSPDVLYDGTTYHMWYSGCDGTFRIGYATSTDGITWTKYDDPATTAHPYAESDPVLNVGSSGEWDDVYVHSPAVLYDGTTYHMWYNGTGYDGTNWSWRIGYATSTDGITWAKYDDPATTTHPFAESDPVLNPGSAGEWDDADVWHPAVLYDGTNYHTWYVGSDGTAAFRIGYATSTNGITWSKYNDPTTTAAPYAESDPVLNPGSAGEWDGFCVCEPTVLYDGTNYHTWYVGSDGTAAFRIGYATNSYIDADFLAIQNAIEYADPGDTIIVHLGTYYETVIVNKDHLTIRSLSGDPSDTIVDAQCNGSVFNVTEDYVTISGLTITGNCQWNYGVYLYQADYCEISHNTITNMGDGIALYYSHHNIITDNFIHENWWSCPFVYSWDGQEYRFDSQILPTAARQARESTDYDNLDYLTPAGGEYRLKATEELFETSYVDELKLVVVDHPIGTQIIPDTQGNIHTLRATYAPIAAQEEDGTACLDEVKAKDGIYWTSNLANKDFSQVEDLRDGIILTFEKPEDAETAKVAVSFRDTKLAERITYGVNRLPTDSPGQRGLLIEFLRCLHLEVWNGTEWVPDGGYMHPGPFIGRDEIKLIDVSAIEDDTITIKLESLTGAVLIDSVRVDYSPDEEDVIAHELSATTAFDADGIDVGPEILASDDDYLVLEEGDYVYLSFEELASNPGYDRSYVVKAEGYYESPLMAPAQGEAFEELAKALLSDHLYAARYFLESALRSDHCGIYLGGSNDNEISDNEVADNDPEPGISVYQSDRNQIMHNRIHGNCHGIYIDDSNDNTIEYNNITENPGANSGIHVEAESSGNVANCNNIEGNGPHGVSNDPANPLLDAENNWWGSADGPSTSMSPGSGDMVSENVDYEPWLRDRFENCEQCREGPPSPPGVPALNPWGIVAMISLFAGLLAWTVRRRRLAS